MAHWTHYIGKGIILSDARRLHHIRTLLDPLIVTPQRVQRLCNLMSIIIGSSGSCGERRRAGGITCGGTETVGRVSLLAEERHQVAGRWVVG